MQERKYELAEKKLWAKASGEKLGPVSGVSTAPLQQGRTHARPAGSHRESETWSARLPTRRAQAATKAWPPAPSFGKPPPTDPKARLRAPNQKTSAATTGYKKIIASCISSTWLASIRNYFQALLTLEHILKMKTTLLQMRQCGHSH
jgi:hypothetical protein